ncbi:MAG: tRNA preQ1(34) S-adenosylmethionine ribosyltransferase-isomerase QueA [Gemmatimonadota bacterium]
MAERQWTASDFDYPLPDSLIAQAPEGARGTSRLLVFRRGTGTDAPGTLDDQHFGDLPSLMDAGDLLVLNSTRVRHARCVGTRPGGGAAEVLLIHPGVGERWIAMGKPGRAMQPGKRIILGPGAEIETVAVLDDGMREVRFVGLDATEAIARFGQLPLPPYITRKPTADDERRYQTVYAEREGSVAAPTAGLHFTDELLATLTTAGITIARLDLEVGPGTFRPVETEAITEHVMHAERFEIPASLAQAVADCRLRGGRVWAVGTTVVRALESAAIGGGQVSAGAAETRLMITPGFTFQVVDRLITNFHLPRSTLLMLVSAFAGHSATMRAYQHAVAQHYRFYSYGDAMCIL